MEKSEHLGVIEVFESFGVAADAQRDAWLELLVAFAGAANLAGALGNE